MDISLSKSYEPSTVEARWYRFWSDGGFFTPDGDPDKPRYCITIPPPNVTGELHVGHALQHSIHDVLIRWHRMRGFDVLCLPGTDHAGIATNRKVVELLRSEGLSRFDVGRERFVDRCWEWTRKYGGAILTQLRLLGCSYDWTRERFTLDPDYHRAVNTAFVRLWDAGMIYRGARITSWCPNCLTTLSDLEVAHEDVAGHLWHIRYPLADGTGYVVVATTRPETLLGDTAVAVHPNDPRYAGQVGKTVRLPLMGREIPVIADPILVDPEFGTGAVKVTPAHDPNDFDCGQRHSLPQIQVIGQSGSMTSDAGRFAGLDRFEAREQVVAALEAAGLLVSVQEHAHSVARCSRCNTILEPLAIEQWFARQKELAEQAFRRIEDGSVRFVPERFGPITLAWREGLLDWPLSRQIWWGHRVPVYTCGAGHAFAAVDAPAACPECGDRRLEQDPDVLDTWFSSALWPFATLGWPEATHDLATYFPTSVLITGRDIIRLWVVRMMFMSGYFLSEAPYREVYVHATVQTAEGRRMSKSLGTGTDPVDMIRNYGADATRLGLLLLASKGQDIRFGPQRLETARNFCNKLWNASRFVLMNLAPEGGGSGVRAAGDAGAEAIVPSDGQEPLPLADRWLLSRLERTVSAVNAALAAYDLDDASQAVYDFVWAEFCDWYLELAKPRLQAGGAAADGVRQTLVQTLDVVLRLLHPFTPFITEAIWQSLKEAAPKGAIVGDALIVARFPEPGAFPLDAPAEEQFAALQDVVGTIRRLKAEAGLPPSQTVEVAIVAPGVAMEATIVDAARVLARATVVAVGRDSVPQPALSALAAGLEVYLPIADVVDLDKEIQRLVAEIAGLERDLSRSRGKLAGPQFIERAPQAVVDKERGIVAELEGKLERAQARLAALERAR